MTQTGACNRHHSVEQQICRWLLMTLDRVPTREIVVTQEMISAGLGVRRESVTEVASALQRSGIIQYRRGHISVLNRSGLNARACECYLAVKTQMEHLLGRAREPGTAVRSAPVRSAALPARPPA